MTASASADKVAAERICGRGSSRWSRPWSWRQSLRLFENTAQVGRQLVGIERRRQVAGDARLRVDHDQCRGMVQGVVAGGFARHLGVRNAQHSCQFLQFGRSEEHTSELQSLMRISYAVFCLKKKKTKKTNHTRQTY